MSCAVTEVNAPNGEPSKLYQDLLGKMDQKDAVGHYLAAEKMTGAYSALTTDKNGELQADYLIGLMKESKDYNVNGVDTRHEDDKFRPLRDLGTTRIRNLEKEMAVNKAKPEGAVTIEDLAQRKYLRTMAYNDKRTLAKIDEVPAAVNYMNTKIKEVGDLLNVKNVIPSDLLYAEHAISVFKSATANMLSVEEQERMMNASPEFQFNFKEITALENRAAVVRKEMVVNLVREATGHTSLQEAAIMAHNGMNGAEKLVLDVSLARSPLMQGGWKEAKVATHKARTEATPLKEEFHEVWTAAGRQLGNKTGNLAFMQFTKDGHLTGSLVDQFTHEYYRDGDELREKAHESGLPADHKALWDWQKENSMHIDPQVAGGVPDYGPVKTQEQLDEHRQKVETRVGKEQADKLFEEAGNKAKRYELEKGAALLNIEHRFDHHRNDVLLKVADLQARAHLKDEIDLKEEDAKNAWIRDNSPYYLHEYMEHTMDKGGVITPPRGGEEHSEMIPSKDEHYDKRYEELHKNPVFSKAYDTMIRITSQLSKYLPEDEQRLIHRNTIPGIQKSMWEAFKDHPFQLGTIFDTLKMGAGVQDQQTVSTAARGPNNEDLRSLRSNIMSQHKAAVEDIVNQVVIKQQIATGKRVTNAERQAIREEAVDALVKHSSMDIGAMMEHYIDAATVYKYKSRIEDTLKVIDLSIHNDMHGYATNKAGELLKDANGFNYVKSDLDNAKQSWNYFFGKFFGDATKVELMSENKSSYLMTSHEKALKKDLESLLESIKADPTMSTGDKEYNLETVQGQLDKLGRHLAGSRVGEMLMKYQIYKSLAYNPFSAVGNVLQGIYSNLIEGSAGEHFTNKEFAKAFSLVGHSMAAFYSGGKIRTETATKIRGLVEGMFIEHDQAQELSDKNTRPSIFSFMKNMGPMSVQQRSEYINQAPLVVAMMMHKKIMIDGVEHSLWDSFDKDGKWAHGENKDWNGDNNDDTQNKEMQNFAIKVGQVMKANHGNYDSLNSPILAKSTITGKAVVMFRSWIFNMFHNRFAGDWQDFTDSDKIRDKSGFYTSIGAYSKASGGPIHMLFDAATQIVRKAAFQGTTFDGKIGPEFTANDAINMRKMFTEIATLMTVTGAYYAVKSMNADDDPTAKTIRNVTLNTLFRLSTDVTFFSSPASAESINQHIIPAAGVLKDSYKVFGDVLKAMTTEDLNEKGPQHRVLGEAMGLIPGITQIRGFTYQGSHLLEDANGH